MEIQRLAESIKDVTDPSSYDKVLIRYEELCNEMDGYMKLLVQKLKFREITWEQPWYQGKTPLARKYQPYYDRNDNETDKFRTDKITKEERDRISQNWRRFTRKYNVPDKLMYFACWKHEKKNRNGPEENVRQFVSAYLARGLSRTIHQVFKYVRNFNINKAEGLKYNKYEEKIIEVCLIHDPKIAPTILTIVLGRQPRGLYHRRDDLNKVNRDKKKIRWNLEQATKLLKLLLKHSELPLEELKYKMIEKSVWLKMEDDLNRHYRYLQYFWRCYLHVQLFVRCDVKLYKLRKKLFKILRDSPYQVWSDIKWKEIVQKFPDGFTDKFLYRMCSVVLIKHPNYLKTPLRDLAIFGLQSLKKSINKRLKTLTLNEEGNLEIIRYPKEHKA